MAQTLIEEVFEEIRKINGNFDGTSIPHSDEFLRTTSSSLGVEPELVKTVIRVLIHSHRIFSIEIIHEDTVREIPGVDGYVIAEISVVRRLKNVFQQEMMHAYNVQFSKNYLVHQIIKEIFPVIRSFNGTPLGEAANKAIMLEELERLMEKNYNEYTDDYKEKLFAREISKANLEKLIEKKEKPAKPVAAPKSVVVQKKSAPRATRAMDTKTYGDFLSKKNRYPLSRILNIYGIDFFYKVNLRNYQFVYLKQLISDGQISKRSDLLHLRDMLRTVRANASADKNLGEHLDDIFDLEKAIVHHLYFSGNDAPR